MTLGKLAVTSRFDFNKFIDHLLFPVVADAIQENVLIKTAE